MKIVVPFVCMGLAFLLAACGKIGITIANLPTHVDGIETRKDIVFDHVSGQKLDIYLPEKHEDRLSNVVVFFYGGRWTTGVKDEYAFVGSVLAKKGFVVVIPDYRKYPNVKFPVFAQDAASAVAWVAENIGEYGGNAKAISVAGHSSGAHLGALIATDERYLNPFGKSRSVIRSFVGLAGPYSFTPDTPELIDMFGPPVRYPEMQVTTYVDGKQPPMLLMYGEKDEFVGRFNLDKLKTSIDQKGGVVKTRIYEDVDHVWIVGSLSWFGLGKATVLEDMCAFIKDMSN